MLMGVTYWCCDGVSVGVGVVVVGIAVLVLELVYQS